MQRILTFAVVACGALIVNQASAAIILEAVANAAPNSGLSSWTISARGTSGEIVNSIAGVDINGVHNVTPAFGSPSVTAGQWTGGNGAGLADWKVYDTYLLFNPTDAANVVGFIGSATETNDGTDPAGLNLNASGQNATEGLGNYKFATSTDQITLTPAGAKNALPFLQVVLPAGTSQVLSATLFDTTGASFAAQLTVGAVIPEPATFAMAGLGLIGVVAASRRRAS